LKTSLPRCTEGELALSGAASDGAASPCAEAELVLGGAAVDGAASPCGNPAVGDSPMARTKANSSPWPAVVALPNSREFIRIASCGKRAPGIGECGFLAHSHSNG
jgi:hypothetical protein